MRKILTYIIPALLISVLVSCQKDPMEEIREGNWNHERNVIDITLENQIGPATIIRDEFETSITAFVDQDGLDLSAVKIEKLVLSYEATANVETGSTLNFNNDKYTAEIEVTSALGESLVWTVTIEPYDMFYTGTWNYGDQIIYIRQEWGSEWSEPISTAFPRAAQENDNLVEVTYEGYANGRTYGTINNSAGTDGEYGVYANDDVDITSKIRHLIPDGESRWEMDLSTNTMYITKDGKTSEAMVTKTDDGMHLQYVLQYKPEEPYWDYGAHDNYLSWSYQYDIYLVGAN